jgi:predicted transcriptional regulator
MPRTTENMSVRIAPETRERLDRIAASLERSRNWLIAEAIEQYLDLYQQHTELIEERLQKAESGEGRFVPHDEVMDRIEAKINARISP